MHTLEEIYQRQVQQDAQLQTLQQQNNELWLMNRLLLNAVGVVLPRWRLTTVDSVGDVAYYTSLAFGPDGQPAISYTDNGNWDLKFARYNGSAWSNQTVDSAGNVGLYTSLAFGPDGQPAISYCDNSKRDLKFARRDVLGSQQ